MKVKPQFYVVKFDDSIWNPRCYPINFAFMTNISDSYESSYTLILKLNCSYIQKQEDKKKQLKFSVIIDELSTIFFVSWIIS